MGPLNGWFPDINSKGEIVAGFGTIWFGDKLISSGVRPKFINDDVIVFGYENGTRIVNIRKFDAEGNPTDVTYIPIGYNVYAAGAGEWAGIVQKALTDVHLYTYPHVEPKAGIQNFGIPVMSTDGDLVIADEYQSNTHTVLLNGIGVFTGFAMNYSVCRGAVAIQVATSVYGRKIVGIRRPQIHIAEDWTIYNWEGPYVWDGPECPWVLSVTQDAYVILRPAGSVMGYKLLGEWNNPAVRFVDGRFIIAASSSRGLHIRADIFPNEPRIDLRPVIIVDPPVELPPDPPRCTITDWPKTVEYQAPATCIAAYHGGARTKAIWQWRSLGETIWVTDTVQSPPKNTHTYMFSDAGTFEISLTVEGPGGSDTTASSRKITVKEKDMPVDPPPPIKRQQIAFGPNLGSNIAQLFTEDNLWEYSHKRISAFQLYVGHIIEPGSDFVGSNTFEHLADSGLFRKLKEWNVLLELQMASGEQPHDVEACFSKIAAEGGHLGAICFDHAFIETSAEAWATRLQGIKALFPAMVIGAYAPFPYKSAEDIRQRLVEWDKLDGRPAFLRIDCDPNQQDKLTKKAFEDLRTMTAQRGMALQMTINARDEDSPDAKWVEAGKKKFDYFCSLESDSKKWDAAMVQSWALVPSAQDRQLPRNLLESEADSHTALVKYCLERFGR